MIHQHIAVASYGFRSIDHSAHKKALRNRGLFPRKIAADQTVWYVRFSVYGSIRLIGGSISIQEARTIRKDAKYEIRRGRFRLETGYQHTTFAKVIDNYMTINHQEAQPPEDQRFVDYWKRRMMSVSTSSSVTIRLEPVEHSTRNLS